jgi:predicted RNA-binding Zn-ribbon protein involved in translation (DUF1610 family)
VSEIVKYTHAEWTAEANRRFGTDPHEWKFVCPSCGNVATAEDFRTFKDAGATGESVTSQCIGRFTGAKGAFDPTKFKPCNYAGFGLLRLSPVRIVMDSGKEIHCFGFAEGTNA